MIICNASEIASLVVFAVNTKCVKPEITGRCPEELAQNLAYELIKEHTKAVQTCLPASRAEKLYKTVKEIEHEVIALISEYSRAAIPKITLVEMIAVVQTLMFEGYNPSAWKTTLAYQQYLSILEEAINRLPLENMQMSKTIA